jgi:hypothetical protein
LAEVKTQHDFIVRINNGNPFEGNPDLDIASDMDKFDKLVKQINKEAAIAKVCHENYFIAFDKYSVAKAAGVEITKRLLPVLDVKIHAIGFSKYNP